MANTTWNPSDKAANVTLSGGNLIVTGAGAGTVRAVDKQITGKFYWEYTCNVTTAGTTSVGVASPSAGPLASALSSLVGTCAMPHNGSVLVDGVTVSGISFGTIANGTVTCIAVDCSARLIWFRLGAGGNWNVSASANPATGVGGISISIGGGIPIYPAACPFATNDQITANFGDTAFTGAVPSGFTSGFTAGASIPTNALATQSVLEQWLATNPDAQTTQVVLEMWASVPATTVQALATLVALEQWVALEAAVTAQPVLVMVLA